MEMADIHWGMLVEDIFTIFQPQMQKIPLFCVWNLPSIWRLLHRHSFVCVNWVLWNIAFISTSLWSSFHYRRMCRPCWIQGPRPACLFWPLNQKIWRTFTADIRFVCFFFLCFFLCECVLLTLYLSFTILSIEYWHFPTWDIITNVNWPSFPHCRSCSRSWSSWRCRRNTLKTNRRTWKRSFFMPKRRWRGYRASLWSLDSS